MYIEYLKLINYRNYDEAEINLSKGTNIFIGDNAQGKTNILESIYFCSLGRSHRTSKDKEIVKWQQKECSIEVFVKRNRIDKKIFVKIFSDGKKAISVNSIKIKKISELMGNFNSVIFSPEDLKIVKESPAYRRKFMDMELCKLNNKYYYNLVQYNKVLNERNISIKKWRNPDMDIIDVYDRQLANFGGYIIQQRINYIKSIDEKSKKIHEEVTSGKEKINFKYITAIKDTKNFSDGLYLLLKENRKNDIEKKYTSVGPHRDDFSIKINDVDTRAFGSQGQQRTAILTIKFASMEVIKEVTGEYPVLLLDDVLSELDSKRQSYILNSIKNVQTLITCTGIGEINSIIDGNAKVFSVKNGKIIYEN